MSFVDRALRCRECGRDFVFTAGEQEFYQLKGLLNDPARCPECRQLRKTQRMSQDGSVGSRGSESRSPREMHPAICADCGAQTLVPFLPRGDKPVYCSTCFDRVRSSR